MGVFQPNNQSFAESIDQDTWLPNNLSNYKYHRLDDKRSMLVDGLNNKRKIKTNTYVINKHNVHHILVILDHF